MAGLTCFLARSTDAFAMTCPRLPLNHDCRNGSYSVVTAIGSFLPPALRRPLAILGANFLMFAMPWFTQLMSMPPFLEQIWRSLAPMSIVTNAIFDRFFLRNRSAAASCDVLGEVFL